MTAEEFTEAVMKRVSVVNPEDLGMIRSDVPRLYRRGFTIDDAVALLRCTEEVNPDLNERLALARMAKINSRYPA